MINCEYPVNHFTTLASIFKLNIADYIFLENIKNKSFDEASFFKRMNRSCNLGFIFKIVNANQYFETLCQKEQYDSLWETQYCLFGLQLTSTEEKQTNLLPHKNEKSFNLLRGAFFFHQSQLVREQTKEPFSLQELRFLKQGIHFNSVHAIQCYNQYVYNKVAAPNLNWNQQDDLLRDAILNCKKLQDLYGSYAYMMLAEAYFHYAQWALREGNAANAKAAIDAALTACDFAEIELERSKYSIHNASLGKGLAASNSFNIEIPSKAKELLENWLKEQSMPSIDPRFF